MHVFKLLTAILLLITSFSFAQSVEKGNRFMEEGRTDLAINEYKLVLNTSQTPLQRYYTYRQLGLAYFGIGSYSSANQYMTLAYNINLTLFEEFSDERASIYNDLGLINSTHRPKKALVYYEKNKAIYTTKYGKNDSHLATVLTNIGVIQIQQKKYDKGVLQLNKALSVNINNETRKAFIFSQLSQAYLLTNQDELAEAYIKDALSIYLKKYGNKHPEVAQSYNSLGNLALYRNDHKTALKNYQYALIANSNYEETDIYNIPSLQDRSLNPTLFLNTLHLKAQAFEQLYFEKSLKRKDLLSAETHLSFCNSLFEIIQRTQPDESDKLALSTLSHSIFQDAVRVSMELAEVSVKKKAFYQKAFYYAENSSSSLLLDAIQDAKAKNFSGLPKEVLEKEKALKASLSTLRKQQAEHSSPDLEKRILATSTEYQKLIAQIERDYPNYYELKFSRSKTTLAQIQEKLPEGETLVQYFMDDPNATLYTFVVSNATYKVYTKSIPTGFNRNLVGFRNAIRYDVPNYINSLGQKIAKTLLPKVPKNTQNIVFIPSGELSKLPFEALPLKDKFLIESYGVSYHYTASLHTNSITKHKNTPTSIGLFAPVTFNTQNTLLGTESEVTEINSQFMAEKLNATSFLKEKASEEVLKNTNLSQFDILHFATHGEVNSNHPELSKIYLKSSDNEDGELHTGEIYNLSLSSSLVTLSACETGLGKQQKGEGVMGLSRALIYAGANNLIVSFWKVDDQATTELMTQFYSTLLSKKCDYKSAIRTSKLALLRSEKYASPKYWSAFVLIGE